VAYTGGAFFGRPFQGGLFQGGLFQGGFFREAFFGRLFREAFSGRPFSGGLFREAFSGRPFSGRPFREAFLGGLFRETFSGRPFQGGLFREAFFREAFFREAFFMEAFFREAFFREAIFREAFFREAFFREAFSGRPFQGGLPEKASLRRPPWKGLPKRPEPLAPAGSGYKLEGRGAILLSGLKRKELLCLLQGHVWELLFGASSRQLLQRRPGPPPRRQLPQLRAFLHLPPGRPPKDGPTCESFCGAPCAPTLAGVDTHQCAPGGVPGVCRAAAGVCFGCERGRGGVPGFPPPARDARGRVTERPEVPGEPRVCPGGIFLQGTRTPEKKKKKTHGKKNTPFYCCSSMFRTCPGRAGQGRGLQEFPSADLCSRFTFFFSSFSCPICCGLSDSGTSQREHRGHHCHVSSESQTPTTHPTSGTVTLGKLHRAVEHYLYNKCTPLQVVQCSELYCTVLPGAPLSGSGLGGMLRELCAANGMCLLAASTLPSKALHHHPLDLSPCRPCLRTYPEVSSKGSVISLARIVL